MLEPIKLLHNEIWSSPLMMALFVLSVGYLLHRSYKKRETRRIQLLLTYVLLTLVLICMNPVLGKLLTRFSGDEYTFIRFMWLIPVFPMIAYAGTCLVREFQGGKRMVATLVMAALILCAGEPWPMIYQKQENRYKVSDMICQACDAIRADAKGKQRVTVDVYLPDNNIFEDGSDANMRYFGVRQYAPEFILDHTTITETQYLQESFSYDTNMVNRDQYIICDRNDNLYRELNTIGYEKLTEVGTLAVFKNTLDITLVFVRHAQTEANVAEVVVGAQESPLTPEGVAQAQAAGRALKGLTFDRAYSSPRERAVDTANYILRESGNGSVEVQADIYLGDINWGAAEGSTWDELRATYGADASVATLFGAVEDEEFQTPIPEADTLAHYYDKYSSAINRMMTACYVDGLDGGTVLLTGHSIEAAWLARILPDETVPEGLFNTSITILHYSGGAWSAETINNVDYDEVAEIVGAL